MAQAGLPQIRSKMAAMPWPPPMHMVVSVYRQAVRRSSQRALTAFAAAAARA